MTQAGFLPKRNFRTFVQKLISEVIQVEFKIHLMFILSFQASCEGR